MAAVESRVNLKEFVQLHSQQSMPSACNSAGFDRDQDLLSCLDCEHLIRLTQLLLVLMNTYIPETNALLMFA
jgi:hypothetical protein